jgi:hypothetical protein
MNFQPNITGYNPNWVPRVVIVPESVIQLASARDVAYDWCKSNGFTLDELVSRPRKIGAYQRAQLAQLLAKTYSDETLAELFQRSSRTITNWLGGCTKPKSVSVKPMKTITPPKSTKPKLKRSPLWYMNNDNPS